METAKPTKKDVTPSQVDKKLQYLSELRQLLFMPTSRIGKDQTGDRIERVCNSIEKDLGVEQSIG